MQLFTFLQRVSQSSYLFQCSWLSKVRNYFRLFIFLFCLSFDYLVSIQASVKILSIVSFERLTNIETSVILRVFESPPSALSSFLPTTSTRGRRSPILKLNNLSSYKMWTFCIFISLLLAIFIKTSLEKYDSPVLS